MTNEIIVIKQLPEIVEQLHTIKDEIKQSVSDALALECTTETVKEIKSIRAALKRDFNLLESKRKEVKSKILSPYEQFEQIYKECVTNIFKPADIQLALKIADVEDGLKEQKKAEIFEYFNELCASKGIDFISFDDIGAVITLTASKKSLKEKVKAFLDKTSDDLAMIGTQEYAAEILVEYKRSLNVSQAIMTVTNRNKAIAAERKRAEDARIVREEQIIAEARIDEVIEEQQILTAPEETYSEENEAVIFSPESEPVNSEIQRSIALSMRIDYPEDKHAELLQMCKEFKNSLMERGFTVVKY
jgi:Protein of unknown function (DUF1351).